MKARFGIKMLFLACGGVLSIMGVIVPAGCSKQGQAGQIESKKTIYTCPMHHQIRKEQPGECPICGMTLVPLEQIEGVSQDKKIKYWASPMNPAIHSDKPRKDEMGMDFVPVYEEEGTAGSLQAGSGAPKETQGLAPVHLSSYKEQLIGVKYAEVKKAPVTRLIRTSGRFAGGEGGFANLAAEFAEGQATHPPGRYVVADVYALDIPLVKTGQKAWVSPLSGSGPKVAGRVSQIYPYEGTQSRIVRVKINLSQDIPREIFANVEIEAVTEPRTVVPSSAVEDTGTRQYVFVATAPGVLTPQTVNVGFRGDDLWEITSGLKPGDKVVDGAVFMIDADSKIKAAFSEGQ